MAGLTPGDYTVQYAWGSGGSRPIAFTLGVRGSTALSFDFTP